LSGYLNENSKSFVFHQTIYYIHISKLIQLIFFFSARVLRDESSKALYIIVLGTDVNVAKSFKLKNFTC